MKKYIKLFLAMTLVIISMFSSARLNTTSALGATGAINITGQSITPTKSPVDQYTDINVNMNFSVPSTAKTGGQAIISLPKNLKFVSDTNFNVMSSDNKIVAKAVLNAASKTITLTYTDYVTKKSDIKGSLFFNVRVSPDTASPSKVPINISVNNKNIPIGNVDFVVDPGKSDKVLDKVSWNTKKLADGGITRDYEVRVNAENKPLTNAIVLDKLNTDGMSYVKDSFVVKKGTWAVNSNLKLELKNATVVSVPVNFDASQKSFQVNLGNVAANEGYSIYYKVKIDKTPKNGQQFLNNVTLKADKVTETKNNPFVYQNAGGEAEGYNYSVKIKKVDSETNAALAGASFDVIRTSTNETVKSVTTDTNGEALIDGLLNTEYKLVETKAPEGYQLNKEAIVVKTTDFNTSKIALKTISNKKIPKEPTPTNATIELDKQLSGRDLVDGEFNFELYEGSNKIQTVSNKNGKITFDAISYKEVGEHTYTVKEVKGDNSTIAYDSSSKQITVKVTKDGDKLKSEVVYPDGNTFNNKFTPNAANATIELDKALSGRDLVDGEFSFELYEGSNKLQTTTNKNGKISFDSISYKEVGEHTYTVKEVKGNDSTITYDSSEKQVTVKVREFSFELYEGSNKLQTTTNKNGKISFDSISYKEVGEHTYTVKEVKGDNNTITYDESEKQVTVKVTKDGNELKSEVVYPESKTFSNTFTPKETSATIELDKQLTGRDLVDGEFSFELYEGSNKLQTTTNKNGKVTFDSISYKEVGEHTYTIKEVKGDNSTVAYDSTAKEVTVKVTRDGDKLKTEVVYPESKTFNNTFTPNAANATIELDKALSGRDLVNGEFKFVLKDDQGNQVGSEATNQNGKITFPSIKFEKEGTYNYSVKEVKGENNTINYDKSEKHVTINVTKDGNNLKAEVVYPDGKTFNNTFTPNATNASIELDKKLDGRDLVDGEFSFDLYEGSNKLQTVTNKNGKVAFDSISYKEVGEHTYTIKEVKGDNSTITYDESEKQVTVKVTRDGDNLKTEVVYPESKTFNNKFTPNEAKATIELEKQLTGRNLADGEFSFDLYEGSNKLQTTTNKNGKVTFDSISYKEVGEHTYTVKEVKGTDSTIAYDESEKHVTVKVTRDGDNLKTEVVYPESKVFHNLFTPNATSAEFSLKKNLSGRDLKDGEFTFTLFDSEGKAVKTVSNDANGNILFNGLIFSKEGRYTYKVVENKNNVEGITYDEVARTVTIDVKLDKERGVLTSVVELPENKVFNNSYKPTTPPKGILPRTGIGALSSSIAGLGILSLVGLAIRRKQKMN